MNNYQLYRTNLLLGGQMKWDLILESTHNTLYVSDFHLTPISDNTPYTYKSEEYLIKNAHTDNVKQFYIENKGNFYKENLNTEFSHNWPIICEENEVINCYSNIYDMGCKRSKRYNIYKKQFEFFCPLWLEHVTDDIVFKIEIKNINTNSIIGSNTLILSAENINNEYHKKFINYFDEYIKNAGLKQGSDDILNIEFNKNEATVTGLHVKTGLFKTVKLNDIITNITSRERPLMEIDNMIIRSLADNEFICKQLFNFNLCFNIEDIFSASIVKMMYGENVLVSVNVYMGNTPLEKKDFYTEYNYIEKVYRSDSLDITSKNVLNYLKDNEYIDFIDKNKFCQSICHWSLSENNEYIFNVYDGFSGLIIKDGTYYINEHQYMNTPNTYLKKYELAQNTIGWLPVKNINNWNDFYKYIKYVNKYKTDGLYLGETTNKYIFNLKYNYIPKINGGIYLLGMYVDDEVLLNIESSTNIIPLAQNLKIYMLRNENLIMLLTNNLDLFSFSRFYDILNNYNLKNVTDEITNKIISELKLMLNSKVDPSFITINSSLLYTQANSPSVKSTEIDYIKDDKTTNYVLRYDGKIKPSFTDNKNTLYFKDYVYDSDNNSKLKNSIYTKYNYLNYEPIYPSLNYCSIKSITNWSYNECPKIIPTEGNEVSIYNNEYEYKWFNNSKILILNPIINVTVINSHNNYKKLDNIVTEELVKYYNINDNNLLKYIKHLYEYTNNWEYYSDTNVNDYTYNITIKLKN